LWGNNVYRTPFNGAKRQAIIAHIKMYIFPIIVFLTMSKNDLLAAGK